MKMRIFGPRDAGAIAVGADDVVAALEQAAEKRGLPIEMPSLASARAASASPPAAWQASARHSFSTWRPAGLCRNSW